MDLSIFWNADSNPVGHEQPVLHKDLAPWLTVLGVIALQLQQVRDLCFASDLVIRPQWQSCSLLSPRKCQSCSLLSPRKCHAYVTDPRLCCCSVPDSKFYFQTRPACPLLLVAAIRPVKFTKDQNQVVLRKESCLDIAYYMQHVEDTGNEAMEAIHAHLQGLPVFECVPTSPTCPYPYDTTLLTSHCCMWNLPV